MLSVNVHLQVLWHNGRDRPDARPAFEKCRSALAGNGGTEVELDLAYNGMQASGLRLLGRAIAEPAFRKTGPVNLVEGCCDPARAGLRAIPAG